MRKILGSLPLALILIGCEKHHQAIESGSNGHPVSVPTWNAAGIEVAAFLFDDDFDNLLEGHESLLKKADLPVIAHSDIVISPEEYEQDFDENEIAADRKYNKKKILVIGTAESVSKDAWGDAYLSLKSSFFKNVQAHLSPDSVDQAATLKRGTRVALVCSSGTRIIGFATLDRCLFVSKYLTLAHASPKEQVRSFFAGNASLPESELPEIFMGYAMGTAPDTPATCKDHPSVTVCDVTTWRLDKEAKARLSAYVSRSVSQIQLNSQKLLHRVPCPDQGTESYNCIKVGPL